MSNLIHSERILVDLCAEKDARIQELQSKLDSDDKLLAGRWARIKELEGRLDSIERQAGDATEYVLAQVNQRLRDECARWKRVAASSEERVQAWANQARIDADMRFKAESRLDRIAQEVRRRRHTDPTCVLDEIEKLLNFQAAGVESRAPEKACGDVSDFGICGLPAGHDGEHSSGNCYWRTFE